MKNRNSPLAAKTGWLAAGLLAVVLSVLFWRSFLPGFVHFSNDGPLGQQNSAWLKLPAAITGMWTDLNVIGFSAGSFGPSVTGLIHGLLGPVGFAKFYTPGALFILGLGAWTFFRQLKLSPLAAMLGALAAMLNTTFFSNACWGTAAQQIAVGMGFFALALIVAGTSATPWFIRWTQFALAGLCVGVNVMEAADIGALLSILVAAFVFYMAVTDENGTVIGNFFSGAGRVAVVAVFAGFIALQVVLSLIGTNIQGVAGAGQDTETKARQWNWATQWSLPKKETFSIFVPGLFGYKMDTPNYMPASLQDAYRGGAYWGGLGRDPVNDRFFDSGGQGSLPDPQWIRQTGSNYYCGILVVLHAAWTVAQSFRRKNSPFTSSQKKSIWFWTAVLFACLLFAWGRYAPFYALLYKLPYFSTIRNPDKFLIFLSWAVVILFAYGIHALSQRLDNPTAKSTGPATQLKYWWAKACGFDRIWIFSCAAVVGIGLIGWFVYASEKPNLIHYLQMVQAPGDPNDTAAFSIRQCGWFVLLFTLAAALVALVSAGVFSGKRAKIGGFLLGLFLVIDLSRADLPFVIHWDYFQKYEVGSLNPVESILTDKSYEHRVARLPFEWPKQFDLFSQIYSIEWTQQHYPYYNIQSLDLIQGSRMPEDLTAFESALAPRGDAASAWLFPRLWQLTNTRYLLGPAGYLDVLNTQIDTEQHRFRILKRFDIVPKPGIAQPTRLEELTAELNDNGLYALFEFTGALPRAKLYSNWQVSTNDPVNLKTLADANFDPAKTVLISTPQKYLSDLATNENSGTVEFKNYAPKDIVFNANATAPSVLLLNDRYDPNWRVTVDGKPADLLRCNFIMRGVYLTPGNHTVEFQFSLPNKPLYITLSAIGTGIILCVILFFASRRQPATMVQRQR